MNTTIKSAFLKKELKKTAGKRMKYIKDLMLIEDISCGKLQRWPSGYLRIYLENKYPRQWKAIWIELNKKGYLQYLKLKKKRELENKQIGVYLKKQKLNEKRQMNVLLKNINKSVK